MARSWEISKAAWGVLRAERGLLAVSIAAHLLAVLTATVVFFAGLALLEATGMADADAAGWAVVAVAALVGGAIAMIGQAVVVTGADQHMEGGDPTVASAFGALRGRVAAVLAWAVITTGVGRALQILRSRSGPAGRTAASGGGFAFRVVSFLALPVLLLEGKGVVTSLRRSWELLKETWGENLSFNFGLKLLGALVLAPAGGILVAAEWAGLTPLPFAAFAPLLLYAVVVVAGVSALSAVFKTALYRWATDASVDEVFDRSQLESAFGR